MSPPVATAAGAVSNRRVRPWVPPVAGLLTAALGLLNLASSLLPASPMRLRELTQVLPQPLTQSANAVAVVTGVLLLLLAHALNRRKRRAWRAVVALMAVSVVAHVIKGLDVEEAVAAAVMLAALVAYRSEFYARGDPRTRWRAVWAAAGLFTGSVLLGLVLVRLRLGPHLGAYSLADQLKHVVYGLVGVTGPLTFRRRDEGLIFYTLAALGTLTILTPAYLALRPAEPVPEMTADDERRLRELLDAHGDRDSLGYFALRRDKAVVWSPTGKAAITYRVLSGVALASGDPLGDPEAWPGAVTQFLALADLHAWVPAVMGCGERGGAVYRRAGLSVLEIGDEAVVEVRSFSLEGRAVRGVRQAVNRVQRAGYSCQMRRVSDLSSQERSEAHQDVSSWRGASTERGFSMALGRFGDPADGGCVLVTAHQEGRIRALLHFVPWGREGLSLDLMRRDRDAENGLNELLIVHALQHAPEFGVCRISLNFAVFRQALEAGERLGAGPVLRAWRGVLLFASRWFQIESLYRFNAKFQPQWEPRYVCFPATHDLPRVTIAALEAEAFLVWPRPSLRRLRRLVGARHA